MKYAAMMRLAIEQAIKGLNTTTPNPRVGCILAKNEIIIGRGYHRRAGEPHAEIKALQNTVDTGHSPQGATAYVTLEPCSHHGKTPPCADALIAAGVTTVIIGSRDPNPQVSGRGAEKLRQAGITVIEDVLREECDELNRGFLKRMTLNLPWVTVKLGMTLDAKIATASGESKWITGEEARADVQHLRARSCAVMTSSATVIADDPQLNVRQSSPLRQPKRIVVDSNLNISAGAKIFTSEGQTIVYTSSEKAFNHDCIIRVGESNGHADLTDVLNDLASQQSCNEILVEAGGRFVGALLSAGLVDELIVYSAPMLLGEGAKSAFNFCAVKQLAQAPTFSLHNCVIIGNDLKVIYRK